MSKIILLASVVLVCFISRSAVSGKSLTRDDLLRCHQCNDCDFGRVNTQTCPVGLVCGTMNLDVNIAGQHKSQVTKSCIPEITTGDCKTYLVNTLRESGLFTEDAIKSFDQLFHLDGVNLDCTTCKSDLCN